MSKGNKASLIMQILLSPIRILGMAPKLYTKGMMGCAGRFGYDAGPGGAMGYNLSDLQRSYTISSCRLREKEEEYSIALLIMALERKRSDMGIRSYSGGIGTIGRIDEERPCSFRICDVVVKARCIS